MASLFLTEQRACLFLCSSALPFVPSSLRCALSDQSHTLKKKLFSFALIATVFMRQKWWFKLILFVSNFQVGSISKDADSYYKHALNAHQLAAPSLCFGKAGGWQPLVWSVCWHNEWMETYPLFVPSMLVLITFAEINWLWDLMLEYDKCRLLKLALHWGSGMTELLKMLVFKFIHNYLFIFFTFWSVYFSLF